MRCSGRLSLNLERGIYPAGRSDGNWIWDSSRPDLLRTFLRTKVRAPFMVPTREGNSWRCVQSWRSGLSLNRCLAVNLNLNLSLNLNLLFAKGLGLRLGLGLGLRLRLGLRAAVGFMVLLRVQFWRSRLSQQRDSWSRGAKAFQGLSPSRFRASPASRRNSPCSASVHLRNPHGD